MSIIPEKMLAYSGRAYEWAVHSAPPPPLQILPEDLVSFLFSSISQILQ